MRALDPEVFDPLWKAVEGLIPPHEPKAHPLGCHRRRVPDRDCLWGIVIRLVTGCSWRTAGRLSGTSGTTLRTRRDEWIEAGVFDALAEEALAGYDKIIGLELEEIMIDGALHKAPFGGENTGPNPTDRAKLGWKTSIATDGRGIPIGWVEGPANRNDCKLLAPTLDEIISRGLHHDVTTLHVDRGYDYDFVRDDATDRGIADIQIPPKGEKRYGIRWLVERANSWLSNYGQIRRNTDRRAIHRLASLALTITITLIVKLVDWNKRWNK